ncbi:GDP-mannose 4,6-dehydratase [Zoogloea sp.]|uniref:GDP-mannose 4,6-dehydratase n=1 Tax=Zoogloea sp. TaxID=49181 RepID=UPI0026161852|nr:GDP-mannose 4,6-dehydratase [uncultured Zoogloea sp.]
MTPAAATPHSGSAPKKALVIGALGQDGTYLTELLLAKGYTIIGTTHRDAVALAGGYPAPLRHLDLRSQDAIATLIAAEQPDEIYNLGARASSAHLSDDAEQTGDINGLAVTRLLEAIRRHSPHSRLCQALSSEIFARCVVSPQNEHTPPSPANAYGAAKTYALHMLQAYRDQYGLFACGAILYNHESPLRPAQFVTRKVTRCVARIASGVTETLQLGNAEHRRDWGHARDHVRAMHSMLQQERAEDFVIATGITHSIADLCRIAFEAAGLDFRDHVTFQHDPSRRSEGLELCGDADKARRLLGWTPEISFEALIREMVSADLALLHTDAAAPARAQFPGAAALTLSLGTPMSTNTPPHAPTDAPQALMDEVPPIQGSILNFGTEALAALLPPQGTFVVQNVFPGATPAARPLERQGISFVICSINDEKFYHLNWRLERICRTTYEVIRIDDARGLSEGYTRGLSRARYQTLVFCHDDIDFLCGDAFAELLEQGLRQFDVIGVAGPRKLHSAFWPNGGPANLAGLVIHGPVGKPTEQFSINYYDTTPDRHIAVEALDGVFIAGHREVFEQVGFDSSSFDGFHLYDIDFTYRCHLAGFRLGVCKDLLLVHSSPGNFGSDWLRYERRFRDKFPALAPARLTPRYSPAVIQAASLAEAEAICRAPEHFFSADTEATKRQPAPEAIRYETWRKRTTPQEIDAQLLAERMVLKWQQRPGIHLLLALQPGEESLLADTLDSLAAQIYPEWLLTVVTALPKPPEADDTPQLQWLALRDAVHIDYVIDEMAAASPGSWAARIEPGLTFEPQALQIFADYINARPQWHLMYCDEDTRELDGSYSQPLFKPDFNLDLLRAQAYLGCFVLVKKEAFLAAGRYGSHAGAENYDLSLRILDQDGPTAIGHVEKMLVHLPRASRRALQPEAEKQALIDHLGRCGLDARVFDGALYGTRRVEYSWPAQPLVSIVIPTREREEYLRPLLDSLQERTRYPNYEIIVVDNSSADPDTLRYLETLRNEPPKKARSIRVIPCPGEFSWSTSANTGVEAARGDYLLFLDNDTHVVQDNWLDRLMGIAQRPEVAIVAPRLSYPESGKTQQGCWFLGMHGTVGNPWDNQLELADPGYMGRALCDQNVQAASGSALLVRRSVLTRLGGFDTTDFTLYHGALDFCLRATGAGHKIVWTPHATLVHYGGVSMQARQRKLEGRLTDQVAVLRANETLLDRWLPRLAHDPAYNRNLSLIDAFQPEHVAPIDWDANFHDRPRILAIPVPGGAGEYRLRAPLRVIGQAGLAQTMICEQPQAGMMRILLPTEIARTEPDVLILHQPLDDSQSDAIANYARHLPRVRRILTIDDLLTELPRKHPSYKQGYKDGRQRLRRNLSLLHRAVVSTRPLADLCAEMIDDVRIMPNCLEWAVWGDAQPLRLPRQKPRVGWAGAQQHQGDLELIYPVVEALADEVDWIFMGMCPEPLKPFVHESHGFERDFRAYPKALARLDLDLAIAPLEIHAFNEAKSNLRLLEYGAMGWPVICTDIHPYQNAPVTRLPNDPQKWISTIREQLAEPAALREAGLALQRWVHEGFILENHTASWFAAYGP